ncbi:uroporphyrinogen-III synthase [Halopseudomonas laoshanensis]|uniref:uroporphyrinogen-III synthase n=1 Tax=Halopseudomonas laoshanensis TaxID=2268758 RepID=UPI00373689BD
MTGVLLLTRSEADNQRLAGKLDQLNVRTQGMPLLHIEPQLETPSQRQLLLNIDLYQAVIVVSPVAARLGLERLEDYWPQMPVGIDWFAVGKSTAEVLQTAGLKVQVPGQGQDSEAVLALPRWQALLQPGDLKVLIWRGTGGREHLAEQLRVQGAQVDYLELYRRCAAQDLPARLAEASAAGARGILVLSVQALEYWRHAAAENWSEQAGWRCWVPSQRVAERAAELGCKDIIVCNGADDSAVIEAVMAHPLT